VKASRFVIAGAAVLAAWSVLGIAPASAAMLGLSSLAGAQTLSWSRVPSPSPAINNTLNGVSCVSASACTAVGSNSSGRITSGTLIESWDGASWSVVPSPSPGINNNLYGVSCVSATACMAVGSDDPGGGGGTMTLTESWDGSSWARVPSPSPVEDGQLHGVSCASAGACMAVGYYFVSGTTHHKTLIESWDGTRWARVSSPSPGNFSRLDGVSCVSMAACVAVGDYVARSGEDMPLIVAWDGASWARVPGPSPGIGSQLDAVSCVPAGACTAAGSRINNSRHDKTLIEAGPPA